MVRITTQKALRREFWATFPTLSRQKIPNYSSDGLRYDIRTLCAWIEWIDMLSKSGDISKALADRATLD